MFMKYSRFHQLTQLTRLAVPVVMSRVGLYVMEIVDTLIIGKVGATALAGVGTGGALFWFVTVTVSAAVLPLDAMLSRKLGAGHVKDAHNLLIHGLITGMGLSVLGMSILWVTSLFLPEMGIGAEMLSPAKDFLQTILLSFPLVITINIMNSFWQARKRPIAMAVTILGANIVNYFANLAFVLGYYGFEPMGAKGAALATLIARAGMVIAIIAYSSWSYRGQLIRTFRDAWSPHRETFAHIFKLGIPAAAQAAAEVGAFSLSTIVITRLGAQATAAHQVLLRIASFTFMFPLGISQATSVMVGHRMGEGDHHGARRAGWSGIYLGAGIMTVSSLAMLLFPEVIYGSFTSDPDVFKLGVACLTYMGIFQVFDGIQVAATGALRGIGNTAASMQANLLGYYLLGLPIGLWLCFGRGMNILGLWIGLATGLIAVAIWLLHTWIKLSGQKK
jgi:MATE family multidrug resistance protein